MPIWSEILNEIGRTSHDDGSPNYDAVRRKYLVALYQHTKRPVILYASSWLQKRDVPPHQVSIDDEDIQSLMEVTSGLGSGSELDLILHSPGGSPETAEAIVSYLRSRFSHIRVIVPNLAMSAATMISCAADEIVMGKHSFLGPTDPQIILPTPLGVRAVPAQAVLDQFERAQQESSDPSKLASWLPMLGQYGPDILMICEKSLELSRELVKTWLTTYMLKESNAGNNVSEEISNWLSDHQTFKSHSRHISRDDLRDHRLNITNLEDDNTLQDLVLSVFHSTTHTFSATSVIKIVENHTGRAFIKQMNLQPPLQQIPSI